LATEEEHFQQSLRNRATALRLSQSGDYEWGVIALFYASLHLVQAYFVRNGVPVQSHRQRDRQIALGELRPVFESYKALRIHSEHARYECRAFTREEFEAIQAGAFAAVVEHVQALLRDVL
jgi:HEPN domain-containing protein